MKKALNKNKIIQPRFTHISVSAAVIPAILLLTLFFSGCTESTYTPSAVSCCTALSLDNADDGLLLTVEITSGSGESGKIYCISETADTIENAFKKMRLVHPGKLSLQTAQSIILSPSLTEEQLSAFFEYTLRRDTLQDNSNCHNTYDIGSFSLQSLLVFSQGCKASDILTGANEENDNEGTDKRTVPVGIVLYKLSEDMDNKMCENTLLSVLRSVYSSSDSDTDYEFDPKKLVLCAVEPDESSKNPDERIRISGTKAYTKTESDKII